MGIGQVCGRVKVVGWSKAVAALTGVRFRGNRRPGIRVCGSKVAIRVF